MRKVTEAIPSTPHPLSIAGWVMRGAVREDDTTVETANMNTPAMDYDPVPVFDRAFGHFFDPINNKGIFTKYGRNGPTAPDWALVASATVPSSLFGGRENVYQITDARNAMWRALTLKTSALADVPFTSNVQGFDSVAAQREDERKAYWATTFRTLGDTVHLLQDMAQPQHTRDDSHSGFGCVNAGNPNAACAGGHASFLELYLKARTLEAKRFTLDEAFLPPAMEGSGAPRITKPRQLTYAGYATPAFANYRDYFATATGAGSVTGRGLANYSNRGFYSVGTNANSAIIPDYQLPHPRGDGLEVFSVSGADLTNMAGDAIAGQITFLRGPVLDSATGISEPNVKLTSVGLWDQFLEQQTSIPRWTLNYYNYDDQAKLLIPRAVAYSAGLIDYFFRGEMDIALPDAGVYAVADHAVAKRGKVSGSDYDGFTKIKAKLRNITPSITPSGTSTEEKQEMPAGIMVAVVKFHLNDCYKSDLSGEILITAQSTQVNPVGCNMSGTNSPLFTTQVEEIVTSQLGVDSSGAPVTSLSLSNYTEVSFTFDQPIPINATDVYLQVVYRGFLGSESDAVVVATKDISEPSHFTIANTTDYLFCVNATLYRNNADGSISAAARNAIIAAGGTQSTADDPTFQKRAHARVLLIAQAPYVQPFSSVNPLTVNPQVKVLADRTLLNYGQHMRLAYLTDRAAGSAIANVNQFEIGIADQLPDRVEARVPQLQNYSHFLHQLSDENPIVTPVMAFRNFRMGSANYTVNEYGASCNNVPDSTLRAIDHSNPSLSALVPFTTINF